MSNIKIQFDIDNAIFEEDLPGEVRRILTHVSDNLGTIADAGELPIRDINGNTIGAATVHIDSIFIDPDPGLTPEQKNTDIDTRPGCGHSACVQHWIETGSQACVMLWACEECGCTDVQEPAWIVMNTAELTGDEPPTDRHYCPQCDDGEAHVNQDAAKPKPYDPEPEDTTR